MNTELILARLNRLAADVRELMRREKSSFVLLTTPLTSTSWDGDSYSTTAKTLIDLSTVFGAPAGIKGILAVVAIRDSGSAAADCVIYLSPTNTSSSGISADCHAVNDRWSRSALPVPCDANGDIYYQIVASGSLTFDIYMELWGYWI